MATYFVATTGNDSTGTGSQGSPWKTFDKAVPTLQPGDTLFVRGGTYTDRATVWCQGGTSWAAGQFVTIAGYQEEVAIVRCVGTQALFYAWIVAKKPNPVQYLKIEKLRWDTTLGFGGLLIGYNDGSTNIGARFCRVTTCELYATTSPTPPGETGCLSYCLGEDNEFDHNILRDCYWGYGVYIKGSRNWVHHNDIHHNDRFGVHVFRDSYPDHPNEGHIIECNLIHDNGFSVHHSDAQTAGALMGRCTAVTFRNNMLYDNARGFNAYGPATNCNVYHNTFVGNGDGITIHTQHTGSRFRNNILWQSGSITGNTGANTITPNLININPQFVNQSAKNFHLTQGSPARNNGAVTLASVPTDYDGEARPSGSGVDFGADEFQEATPTTIHYIAPSGNNGNPGSEAQPWQTINYGLSQISAGHTLVLRAGSYAVDIDTTVQNIPAGTSWDAPTVLKAYAGETVTIRRANLATAGVQYVVFEGLHFNRAGLGTNVVTLSTGANRIRFESCEMTGATSNGVVFAAHASGGFNELLNCDIHHNGTATTDDGIEIACASNLVHGNDVHHNAGPGINFISGSATNTIRNNRIHHNNTTAGGSAGLLATSGDNHLFYNNLVYANTSGIHCSGTGQMVQNNTCHGNAAYGVRILAGGTNCVVENNILFGNTTLNYQNNGTGTVASNQTTTDPLFVDSAGGDFHLLPGSPAIDAGKTIAATAFDAEGLGRPQGVAYDTGAYEFNDFPAVITLSPPPLVLEYALAPPSLLVGGGGAEVLARAARWRRLRR